MEFTDVCINMFIRTHTHTSTTATITTMTTSTTSALSRVEVKLER